MHIQKIYPLKKNTHLFEGLLLRTNSRLSLRDIMSFPSEQFAVHSYIYIYIHTYVHAYVYSLEVENLVRNMSQIVR